MKTSLTWQQQLATAITSPQELITQLNLPRDLIEGALVASQQFNLRVPLSFVNRMQPGNPSDPLLLQVLPQAQELVEHAGFSTDPLHEDQFNPLPGVLHKYQGRVLLITAGACAINCRYCFRRHFPYRDNLPSQAQWQPAMDYIARDPTIREVILSGGDPLMLKDSLLADLIQRLSHVPHLKRLRIHTRLPIVLPARITDEFVLAISATHLKPVVVLHSNHPREINQEVVDAVNKLVVANVPLFNQSVLLRNVNDDAGVLIELSEVLFAAHIVPYYLHWLDPVQGAAHFAVSKVKANEIYRRMQDRLSGYLLPKLVCEVPGGRSKQPL